MRRFLLGALAVACLATGAIATPALGAGTTQQTFTDIRLTHTPDRPTNLRFNSPASWTSPVNYAGGKAYLRLQIHSKPSNKLTKAGFCLWRSDGVNKWRWETCASPVVFSTAGTYYLDMGTPNNWWKLNGVWDFSKAPTESRIMFKDASNNKLLMKKWCGPHCYVGNDLAAHVPIDFTATVILVAPGARLDPPASFQGCPSTWSTECPRPV